MPKKDYYSVKRYPVPPYTAPRGKIWVKVWRKIKRRVVVPAKYKIKRRFRKFRKPKYKTIKGKRIKRRGRFVRVKVEVRPERHFYRLYRKLFWTLQPKVRVVRPRKEHWVLARLHLEKAIRRWQRRYPKDLFIQKTELYGKNFYFEIRTKFNYTERKLPRKDKFIFFSVYYFLRSYDSKSRSGYKLIFDRSSYGDLTEPLGIFELRNHIENYIIPLHLKRIEKAKVDLAFLEYFGFSAMTPMQYGKGRARIEAINRRKRALVKKRILLR